MKKGGPGYVIIRRGALGVLKAANRYPLTGEGWAQVWQKPTELDPAAAGRVRDVLIQRTTALAQPASAPEPPAPTNALAPRLAPRREKEAWSVRVANTLTGLGVRVRDGDVYPYPTRAWSAFWLRTRAVPLCTLVLVDWPPVHQQPNGMFCVCGLADRLVMSSG